MRSDDALEAIRSRDGQRALGSRSGLLTSIEVGLERAQPPRDEAELVERARLLAGRTVGDLAECFGVLLPAQPSRAKGLVGVLVERALGASARSAARPDFPELGVELKTIPLDARGRPRESTFVCTARLRDLADTEWEASPVRRKLARVLFVPIEADASLALGARRIGAARLWSPSEAEQRALRADWEELVSIVGRGDVEQLTAHVGRHLQIRPKAAHGRSLGRGVDERGAALRTLPRGFYLRASFTATIFK